MRKILLAGVLAIGLCSAAWGQNAVVNFKTSNTTPGSKPVTDTLGLPVNCILGCSGGGGGGTSSNFGAAFPTPGTAAGFSDGTNMQPGRVSSAALASGFSPPTAGLQQMQAFLMLYNGATFDLAQGLVTGTLAVPSTQYVSVQNADPCFAQVKSSVAINITTATTTALVPVSGATIVYACGFSMTIAPSATAADTALFEYGSGTACATSPIALTGTYGNGDLTSAAPVVPINYGGGQATIFKSIASNGICMLTTGTAVNVQGVLSYVQQ